MFNLFNSSDRRLFQVLSWDWIGHILTFTCLFRMTRSCRASLWTRGNSRAHCVDSLPIVSFPVAPGGARMLEPGTHPLTRRRWCWWRRWKIFRRDLHFSQWVKQHIQECFTKNILYFTQKHLKDNANVFPCLPCLLQMTHLWTVQLLCNAFLT